MKQLSKGCGMSWLVFPIPFVVLGVWPCGKSNFYFTST